MSQDTDEPPSAAPTEVLAEFAEFYRSHRLQLLRFVQAEGYRNGVSEAHLDAEGVVQETFNDAFVQWVSIQHPEGWIYTVAKRKILKRSFQEWYRDRRLRRDLETVYSEKFVESHAHIHAVANDIIDLIKRLPPNQRNATFLSGFLGWTGPEIAEFLDVAPATVYVHVSRGIKAIRENGYEHSDGALVKHIFCCRLISVEARSSTNWMLSRNFFELPWRVDPWADKIRSVGRARLPRKLPGRSKRKKSPKSRRRARRGRDQRLRADGGQALEGRSGCSGQGGDAGVPGSTRAG